MFRAIVSVSAILWLILILKKPEFLPKKSGLIVVSGLFIIWLAIANFFGVDRFNSYLSNFERMEGWFTHLYLFIYLVILSSVLNTEKLWNWFFGISIAAANIVGLYGLFDEVARTQVFLGNSTYVAIYVFFNMAFAILLGYRFYKKNIQDNLQRYSGLLYYLLSVVLFVYIIFRTQTRGTVLALGAFVFVSTLMSAYYYRRNKKVRTIAGGLIVAGLVVVSIFYLNRQSSFVQNNPMLARVASISISEGTGQARIVNWTIASEGIKERPIFGWGQENYSYLFQKHYDARMHAQEPWFDRTHNVYLDWATQGGLPALLLYLLLFATAGWVIHRSTSLDRVEKSILIATLAGYAVHNMFVFDNYSSYLMFFSLLAFCVHHSQKEIIAYKVDEKTKQVISIVLIFVLLVVSYFVIIKPYNVGQNLIAALTSNDAELSLKKAQDILDANTFGTSESVIRILAEHSRFTSVSNPEFIKEYIDLATFSGEQMIADFPQNVRVMEAYAGFLLKQNRYDRAIEVLERAQELAPNRHNNIYLLVSAYFATEQYEKAKEVLESLLSTKPDIEKVRVYYGTTLLLTGDQSGNDYLGEYDYRDPFYLQIFNLTKKYDQVVVILEKRIEDEPTNYQLQISLAVAYVYVKEPAKAIVVIQNVIKQLPEFEGQGNSLIKEIRAGRNPAEAR